MPNTVCFDTKKICPNCGKRSLYWMNCFSAEDYGWFVNGLVTEYTCANCEADVTVFVPEKKEEDEQH